MASYRNNLPQIRGGAFLTDGGLETTLVFLNGIELPYFAAFTLLETEEGRSALKSYFAPYLQTARERGLGFVLDTPTWRANRDWGEKLGYSADMLEDVQRRSVALASDLRRLYGGGPPIVLNGVLGPRGDGYKADARMSAEEAEAYHAAQITVFCDTDADMVSAITMTYPDEAIGITRAAQTNGVPVVISFTVETDGRLPSGDSLGEAIERVEDATRGGPAYYMINCAHPCHFESLFAADEPWQHRIRGLRANASPRSHAELDEATELDIGDPKSLGEDYRKLRRRLPGLCVMGGCCGTDHRHITAICEACLT